MFALERHALLKPSLAYYRLMQQKDPFALQKYEGAMEQWRRDHESLRQQLIATGELEELGHG